MIIFTAHLGHISLKTINFSQREDNIRALIVKSPSMGKPLLYTRKNDGVRKISILPPLQKKLLRQESSVGAESGRNPREEENIYVIIKWLFKCYLLITKAKTVNLQQ